MRLYAFSAYKKQRDASRAALAVVEVVADINRPGAVIELKRRVNLWLDLYKEAARRKA
jgi:hypothetical protein